MDLRWPWAAAEDEGLAAELGFRVAEVVVEDGDAVATTVAAPEEPEAGRPAAATTVAEEPPVWLLPAWLLPAWLLPACLVGEAGLFAGAPAGREAREA